MRLVVSCQLHVVYLTLHVPPTGHTMQWLPCLSNRVAFTLHWTQLCTHSHGGIYTQKQTLGDFIQYVHVHMYMNNYDADTRKILPMYMNNYDAFTAVWNWLQVLRKLAYTGCMHVYIHMSRVYIAGRLPLCPDKSLRSGQTTYMYYIVSRDMRTCRMPSYSH